MSSASAIRLLDCPSSPATRPTINIVAFSTSAIPLLRFGFGGFVGMAAGHGGLFLRLAWQEWLKQRISRRPSGFGCFDGKPHFVGLFANLKRQKCTARPLLAYHLLHALHGLRVIPKLQGQIGALVASQSIACQFSDPRETVAEIAFDQRTGDWLIFRRCAFHPRSPFQPPSPPGNHTPDGFHYPKRPRTLKKTVQRSEGACACKGQNEPAAAMLQRIEHQHGRDSE